MPLRILLAAVVAVLLVASASSVAKIDPYRASFDFTPAAQPALAPVASLPDGGAPPQPPSIAILTPVWSGDQAHLANDPDMKQFSESVGEDLPELFLAKTAIAVGPFKDIADMTYSEKKAAKLALLTELQVTPFCETKALGIELVSNGKPWNQYLFTPGVSGTVFFKVVEPLSKEVLWHQKLELPRRIGSSWEARTDGSECEGSPSGWHLQNRNEMLRALEKQYRTVFEELDARLTRATLDELAQQSDEIKAKKVF